MTNVSIAQQRLYNQHIAGVPFEKPEEAVQWLGAVQSQDYGGAKWAVAQRTLNTTDAALDRAFAEGTILRTHVLRPTWHFVMPTDIRWMLELTAPRVNALAAYYYRKLELDDAAFAQSNAVLIHALQGGKQLTRAELATVFQHAGIATNDLRLGHMIMHAELEALICSGALHGKQHTYALLAERAPQAKSLPREETLATLAMLYVQSRGPATLKDYIWWSGLTAADAKAGFDMIATQCVKEVIEGQTYWRSATTAPTQEASPVAYLLPNYDEYTVGYTDRSAVFDDIHTTNLDSRGNPLFNNCIIMDGLLVGTWKRTIKKNAVIIETNLFTPLNEAQTRAVSVAAERYGQFVNLPVTLE